jgi:site-specific recombinase XerD
MERRGRAVPVLADAAGQLRDRTVVDGTEVKNGEPVEVQLSHRNSQLLHRYITRFRPLIHKGGTALFPQPSDGAPRTPGRLGADLQAVLHRKTGLTVNAHLFRHLSAKLYLSERPGDFETVRRLLKHRKLQTTMEFYAELSNRWAHEHYDKVVLSKWLGEDEGHD